MSRDEEEGYFNIAEKDHAIPTGPGIFFESRDQDASPNVLPRTGTGFGSIKQAQQIPEIRPASIVESVNSNATGPGNPETVQTRTKRPLPGIHSSSQEEVGFSNPSSPPHQVNDVAEFPTKTFQNVRDKALSDWLLSQFRSDLFHKLQRKDGLQLRISLAGLNRMRMRKLQVKLVEKIIHMRYYKTEPQGWEDLLSQYIEASKDFDYIRACVSRKLDDPFVATSERRIDAQVFKTLLNTVPPDKRKSDGLEELFIQDGLVTSFAPSIEKGPEPIGGTRVERTQQQKTQDFLSRLSFAVMGGIFLIAPMWLMVLVNTKYTALATTSVSVLLWGMATAWKLEGGPLAVLSTTAAYAAVLVVFVGTNTSSS